MLRDMFKKTYTLIDTKYKNHSKNEPNIPEGLWRKCKKCGQPVYGEDVKNNNYICPKCKAYFREEGSGYQRKDTFGRGHCNRKMHHRRKSGCGRCL